MIDGISFQVEIKDIEKYKLSSRLTFTEDVDTSTGEIVISRHGTRISKGSFEHYKLVIKENRGNAFLIVKGSLHKNHQNGENYHRFTYEDMKKELVYLEENLKIKLEDACIKNIEIGVNLEVDFKPFECLEQNLLSYKGSTFNSFAPNRQNGSIIGFDCEKTQYKIKIYDKGKQYNYRSKNILRFEVKTIKMQSLKKYGFETLADLTDEKKVKELKYFLLEKLAHIIMDDNEISAKKIPNKDAETLRRGRLHNNWKNLIKLPSYELQRSRNRFNRVIQKHGISYKQRIKEAIDKEWELMFSPDAILLPYDKE